MNSINSFFDPEIEAAIVRIIRAKLESGISLKLPVTSSSMSPILNIDDMVEITALPESISELRPGTIVVFLCGGNLHIHRFLRILPNDPASITTRGDAQFKCDPPVPLNNVVGVAQNSRRADQIRPLTSAHRDVKQSRLLLIRLVKRKCLEHAADSVVWICKVPFVRKAARGAYYLALMLLRWVVARTDGPVLLRGSMLSGNFEPGVSDIDLVEVCPGAEPASFTKYVLRRQDLIRRVESFVLILGGINIFPSEFLPFWIRWGGLRASSIAEWRPINGRSVKLPTIQLEDFPIRLSAIREFCSSYKFAYRDLYEYVQFGRPSAWLRLYRHLDSMLTYFTLFAAPASQEAALRSMRAKIQLNLETHGEPGRDQAVETLREVLSCCTACLADSQVARSLVEQEVTMPSGELAAIWEDTFRFTAVPGENSDHGLSEFFQRQTWPWWPAPLPGALASFMRTLGPLGALYRTSSNDEESRKLICCEVAHFAAIFFSQFRYVPSSTFLGLGLYFVVLEELLKTNQRPAIVDRLLLPADLRAILQEDLDRGIAHKQSILTSAEAMAFGPRFLTSLQYCQTWCMR